ncbi:uncharacterized protein LOC121856305 [Homarus americanus]|uniref:Uncharacterized protein n=1 Tax=Homarus americanus TaxID=6706 RepID=A0A8J5MK44_HOMAM|nr:uncharacterized protein LOC121856305 [Homarus americanus]KAG7154369.1 hypothetical protein Hamer_G017573 [Homarus americanus]
MADKGQNKSAPILPFDEFLDRYKPKMTGRTMKYPYTFTAKLASFPYSYILKNVWMCKYYLAGVVLSMPLFYKIQQLSNSPANVAKFEAKAKAEAAGH